MGGFLKTVFDFASNASPAFSLASNVVGFFTSRGARKSRARAAAREKIRARRAEDLQLGAAKNIVKDIATQTAFTQQGFNIGQRGSIMQQQTNLAQGAESLAGSNLLSGSGIQGYQKMQEAYAFQQQAAGLGLKQDLYSLEQQKESRIRDVESNLLELSAYSGRNISVLDMYNIG